MNNYNPLITAVYFAAVITVVMFTMDPVIMTLSLIFSIIVYGILDKMRGFRQHLPLLILGIILALLNPLTHHNGVTILFVMNDNPITLEALIYGIMTSFKIISVLYWFRSFSLLMTEDKLLYVLGRFSPKISLVLSMAIRYIPLFKERMKRTNEAQKAIGLYKEDNLIDTIRGGIRVFSIMVTWALENGIITADSMAARGYGTGRRTSFSLYRFKKKDILCLIILMLLFIPMSVILLSGRLKTVYYPELIFSYGNVISLIMYLLFFVFAAVPLILKLEEQLSWRFYLSKI